MGFLLQPLQAVLEMTIFVGHVEIGQLHMVLSGADNIVLGCSHYPFLSKTIRMVANDLKPDTTPYVDVIDPAPAIARHLYNVLLENNIKIDDNIPCTELFSSGSDEVLQKLYERCLCSQECSL